MSYPIPLLLAGMTDGLLNASYFGITLFLILTGCGLPIPEEVGIIAAGVWAGAGEIDPWLAMLSCLVGCLVGDSIMYGIGYRFGRRALREHPRLTGFLTPERERKIEELIRRRGAIVLFTARFLVGIRSPVYLTAGILHFPFRRFILLDLVCASFVIALFFGLSYYFGEGIGNWIRQAEVGLTVVLVIGGVVALAFFWFHHRRSKQVLEELDEAPMTVLPPIPTLMNAADKEIDDSGLRSDAELQFEDEQTKIKSEDKTASEQLGGD